MLIEVHDGGIPPHNINIFLYLDDLVYSLTLELILDLADALFEDVLRGDDLFHVSELSAMKTIRSSTFLRIFWTRLALLELFYSRFPNL